MPSYSVFGCTNRSERNKNISFHGVPSEQRSKELRTKWIQSIKRTVKLLSDGRFFICDSHFDESYFKRDLIVITLVMLCLCWWLFEELNIPIYFMIIPD